VIPGRVHAAAVGRRAAWLVVAAVALGGTAAATVRPPGLEVRVAGPGGRRVAAVGDLRPGQAVELHYRHSVERTPVVEVFRAEPDGLWFVEMRFVSQGAGLPTEGYVREGDVFVLRRPHRVGALPVLVSSAAGHRLRAGSREIDLVAAFGDGPLTITAAWAGWRLRLRGGGGRL
jgi:hypothetical protein